MAKCAACGRFTSSADGVKCYKCVGFYHRSCVNIQLEAKLAPSWLCPGCKASTPKKDNSEQPVGGGASYPALLVSPVDTSDEILREIKLMNQEMRSFREDFNAMREDMNSLRGTVASIGGRMDGMETRLAGLEEKFFELQTKPQVNELLTTIEDLRSELNDRDQESFHNDIEISGIPEDQGENVGHLVSIIADKLGVSVDDRDFVLVERAGGRRAPSGGSQTSAPRPRPVLVRLARRQVRDAFLQAARVRRAITTEGLGLTTAPARVYINERLTKHNKMLFYKVREEARLHEWRYAWTRGGRIYVRRESGKAAFRVRSGQDLQKIFGDRVVGLQLSQG